MVVFSFQVACMHSTFCRQYYDDTNMIIIALVAVSIYAFNYNNHVDSALALQYLYNNII